VRSHGSCGNVSWHLITYFENMNVAALLLDSKLPALKIGDSIDNIPNLELICNEEGDSPALYGHDVGNLYFEITVLKNTVIGIQFDFSYGIGKISFEIAESKIMLDGETELADLHSFLKKTNLDFDIFASEIEPKRIALTNSNSNFYFSSGEQLLKISNFDWKPYEKLADSN